MSVGFYVARIQSADIIGHVKRNANLIGSHGVCVCVGRDMCLRPLQNGQKCHKALKSREFNCVVMLTASIRRSNMSHWSGDGLLLSLSLV